MPKLEHRGCSLAYRLAGSGPPVLLVQGVGVHGDGWLQQVANLRSDFTLLSFDNRGMAGSQPLGVERLTIDHMVDDALALMDHLGWDDAHVVGHSMGGHIATALALLSPNRVRSLALLCTSARGRDLPPVSLGLIWTSLRMRVGTRRQRRRAFLEVVLPPAMLEDDDLDAAAERLAGVFGHDLADTPPVVMKQVGAYRRHDPGGRLADLATIPTLVASATHDRLAPPGLGRALASAIPGARFVEIPAAAHGVTATHADDVNRLLREHFDLEPVAGSDGQPPEGDDPAGT